MPNDNITVAALMQGAYDLHMHAAPSPFQRQLDDYELLRQADRAGMAGILLKSHYESTAARATLVNTHAETGARAYGSIVLNWPVGGLNPYAAVNALKRGAKIVFMPTRDSANSLQSGDMPGDFFKRQGITILDEQGKLKSEVYDIMDAVKSYNAALATGHLSPAESIILCREGTARGVRMVLTHPEFSRTIVPAEQQKKLSRLGVYIEKCWYNLADEGYSPAEMAANIHAAGIEHCFMSTDRGQKSKEPPVEAMRLFMTAMLTAGLSENEVYTLTHTTPRLVLGL